MAMDNSGRCQNSLVFAGTGADLVPDRRSPELLSALPQGLYKAAPGATLGLRFRPAVDTDAIHRDGVLHAGATHLYLGVAFAGRHHARTSSLTGNRTRIDSLPASGRRCVLALAVSTRGQATECRGASRRQNPDRAFAALPVLPFPENQFFFSAFIASTRSFCACSRAASFP